MPTVREAIVAAAVAALQAPGGPAGLTVHRSRHRPIESDSLPATVVYLAREAVTPSATDRVDRDLTLRVECRAKGDPTDSALDELTSWVVRRLTADVTLGGLAGDVDEVATVWEGVEMDRAIGRAAVEFAVTYTTERTDPEVQG